MLNCMFMREACSVRSMQNEMLNCVIHNVDGEHLPSSESQLTWK
jgi:hypothetical protein